MLLCSACQDPVLPVKARGLCRNCYQRWNKTGSTDRQKMKRGPCIIDGCVNMAHGRGMCHMHLRRERVSGSTADPRVDRPKPMSEYDLYPQWVDFQRVRNPRPVVPEWKTDFFAFMAAVGDRPSKQYRLYRIDKSRPMGPGNFEWRDTLVEKLPGETKRDYNIRASKAHREAYKDDYKNHDFRRMYGADFTVERYNAMSEAQGHRCAVCGGTEIASRKGVLKALAVDHCHDTKKVRGLLCQACNQGLGFFKDDLELMAKAMLHIAAHKDDATELPRAVKLLLNAALT